MPVPILTDQGGGIDLNQTVAIYEVTEIEYADGIEIYKSTNGQKYALEKTLTKQDLAKENNKITLISRLEEHNCYKIRAYKTVNGSKKYSEYTEVYELIHS